MAALDQGKGWAALFIGLVVAALGIIPLLHHLNLIAFNLPQFIVNIIPGIALWLIAIIAVYLFIDALMEDDTIRVVSIIVSLIFFSLGVLQILANFGIIGFSIPFLGPLVYYIIFVIEGLFLVIAAFAMD